MIPHSNLRITDFDMLALSEPDFGAIFETFEDMLTFAEIKTIFPAIHLGAVDCYVAVERGFCIMDDDQKMVLVCKHPEVLKIIADDASKQSQAPETRP